MLFITNRRVLGSRRSQVGREIRFDLDDNEPGTSVFFCERKAPGEYVELLSAPFFSRLRRSSRQQILLFLHGYNCQPELPAFPDAERLCDALAPGLVEVVPMLWPCDDDFGLVLDYFDDQRAADASGLTFARVLGKFMGWRDAVDRSERCLKHVNILAHSMGGRVLRGALAGWAHDYGAVPALFRSIVLAAADLANDCLEPGAEGGMIPDSGRNVVVYHAHDDLALRSSKVANVHNKIVRRRLGHTGPADLARTPRNVVAVDCDAFNDRCDRLGHSYFLAGPDGQPGPLLRHLVDTLRTGRVPGAGSYLRRVVLPGADLTATAAGAAQHPILAAGCGSRLPSNGSMSLLNGLPADPQTIR